MHCSKGTVKEGVDMKSLVTRTMLVSTNSGPAVKANKSCRSLEQISPWPTFGAFISRHRSAHAIYSRLIH